MRLTNGFGPMAPSKGSLTSTSSKQLSASSTNEAAATPTPKWLELLTHLQTEKGWLSGLVIDEADNMPSSSVYRTRFGSLVRAYQLIGYSTGRDYRYIDINRTLRDMHPGIVAQTTNEIRRLGGEVERDPKTDLLHINREFTVVDRHRAILRNDVQPSTMENTARHGPSP